MALVGARGPSEFWARSAEFDGVNGSLERTTGISGISDGKKLTVVLSSSLPASGDRSLFGIYSGNNIRFLLGLEITGQFSIQANNSSGAIIYENNSNFGTFNNGWMNIALSIDLGASGDNVYANGASIGAASTFIDDVIPLTASDVTIANTPTYGFTDVDIGFIYVIDQYIDFSQESNRLLFFDAFNYPVDIQKHIDGGIIPNPLIYMKFDDTSNLGLNSGTGGNFTVNGTVTPGADVRG